MNTKTNLILLTGLIVFSLSFTSCEKNPATTTTDITAAQDDALASLMFDDAFTEVEDAMSSMENQITGNGLKSADEITCKTITVEQPDDSTYWPRTVTIDYGDGCTGPNGRVRKGKIIVVVNGWYPVEGYTRSITFDNYYIDDYKIEGTRTVTNEGTNESGNISFSVELTGGKVTSPDGNVITRTYSRTREWVNGADTPRYRFDDEYLVTGEASGINRNGVQYTRTIVTPLHISFQCRWIMSGTVEISAEGYPGATLDYGDDTCDRFATVTVDGETKTITLHR